MATTVARDPATRGASPTSDPASGPRRDAPAAATCAAAAMVLWLLPHLLWWPRLGEPRFWLDHDDVYYQVMGTLSYLEHPGRLGDPGALNGGPSPHKPLPFAPGILLAWSLGAGPGAISPIWKALAAAGTSLGLYALIRQFVRRPWVACALAVVILSDPGWIRGRPFLHALTIAGRIATGAAAGTDILYTGLKGHWRVYSPGLTSVYLFAFPALLARARRAPTRGRVLAAGVAFGLLFHVYFYYWTAAGLALLICLAVDAGHRRTYLQVGVVGGLVGLPSVLSDLSVRGTMHPDWGPRVDKFIAIPRTDRLTFSVPMLAVLVGTTTWVLRGRRDLIPVWAMATAGTLLGGHQLVTRLFIENFHWVVYVGNTTAVVLLALLAAGWASRRPWGRGWRWAFGLAVAGWFALGATLLGVQALREGRASRLLGIYRAYRDDLRGGSAAGAEGPLPPGTVLAGPVEAALVAAAVDAVRPLDGMAVELCPGVGDAELIERKALNVHLMGWTRAEFEADLAEHPAWALAPPEATRRCLDALEAVGPDAARLVDRHRVAAILLPTGRQPAPIAGRTWTPARGGATYTLWRLDDPPAPRAAGAPDPPAGST